MVMIFFSLITADLEKVMEKEPKHVYSRMQGTYTIG